MLREKDAAFDGMKNDVFNKKIGLESELHSLEEDIDKKRAAITRLQRDTAKRVAELEDTIQSWKTK